MPLIINGQAEEISAGRGEALTLSRLLILKQVEVPEMLTVQVNGELVDRDDYDTKVLAEGDEVEFLYFMGGGTSGYL